MTATAAVETVAPPTERQFLGHPRGLFLLFFTEMWERFSYYGMRSLLVLYMVKHLFVQPDVGQRVLGFTALRGVLEHFFGPLAVQPLSSQIYGLYTGFVYFTPFFGGMLADRVIGQRKAVILGAVLMAIGHFMMASERMFFLALMFLIAGNGCFKPNISTQVGLLYPQGDPRRDGAFTIFYMGINLGAFFSPLVCGTLGQTVGWHWGFGAAGVGMVIGLIIYLWGQRFLALDVLTQRRKLEAVTPKQKITANEWQRIGVLLVVCFLVSVFWAVFEQQGNTMQLWADKNTNWTFGGFQIPSTWYQAFNPFMIFAFAPLLSMLWANQARNGKEPASLTKMGFGCLLLGLSFIVMIVASQGMAPDARRSVLWLVGTTVILTLGELYLSPIGLSFVTKVAPARMVSMLMGTWFLANFIGNYLSGYLGTFWETISHEKFFMLMTVLGIGAGIAMLVLSRPMNKIVASHDRRAG
ncbi:MAG: peptide MFS transporter [Candidatus Eisenbacteria bacterium]|nr:peptide MFS transporter [Candidatus Eisenbacteria bacterium]